MNYLIGPLRETSTKKKVAPPALVVVDKFGGEATPSTVSEGERFMGDGTPGGNTSPRQVKGADTMLRRHFGELDIIPTRADIVRQQCGGVLTPKGLWERSGCKKK